MSSQSHHLHSFRMTLLPLRRSLGGTDRHSKKSTLPLAISIVACPFLLLNALSIASTVSRHQNHSSRALSTSFTDNDSETVHNGYDSIAAYAEAGFENKPQVPQHDPTSVLLDLWDDLLIQRHKSSTTSTTNNAITLPQPSPLETTKVLINFVSYKHHVD